MGVLEVKLSEGCCMTIEKLAHMVAPDCYREVIAASFSREDDRLKKALPSGACPL